MNKDKKTKYTTLHRRTHWRALKNTIFAIADIESKNLSSYDLANICCYSCYGNELQGKNIKFINDKGYSCFMEDNFYEMYEVPKKKDAKKPYGEYIFLAHNVAFNYWLFRRF